MATALRRDDLISVFVSVRSHQLVLLRLAEYVAATTASRASLRGELEDVAERYAMLEVVRPVIDHFEPPATTEESV